MRMKLFAPTALVAALALATPARSQTPTSPDNTSAQAVQTQEAAAEAPSSPTPIPVEPPSLIPPNLLSSPGPSALPPEPTAPDLQLLNALFKESSLGKTADEHRLHEQAAALKVRIRNDQDLHKLKAFAQQAPTDLEKRRRLKVYYDTFYKKLSALADTPDLKAYIKAQRAGNELLLLQPHVRHETDEAELAKLALDLAGAPGATPAPAPPQADLHGILPSDHEGAVQP